MKDHISGCCIKELTSPQNNEIKMLIELHRQNKLTARFLDPFVMVTTYLMICCILQKTVSFSLVRPT